MRKDKHVIAGFFYNPNIHPYPEYLKRKDAVERYSKLVELNVIYSDYDLEDYFQNVVYNEDAANRCPVCWWIRMKKCVKKSKENGFDAFTTTLLGSPYQGHEALRSICDDIAKSADIKFYYDDFRTGFRKAQGAAKSNGIYRQNYCGCLFSEKEKMEKKGKKL